MWATPRRTTQDALAEPVTLEKAKGQCNILEDDAAFDDKLGDLITTAREHVEAYCGVLFISRGLTASCDCWRDLARLPVGPVSSVSAITYVDADGNTQTLDGSAWELRIDGLEAAIVPAFGVTWPAIRAGSRITVTLTAGFGAEGEELCPKPVRHAILLFLSQQFEQREPVLIEGQTVFDHLLANFRRYA